MTVAVLLPRPLVFSGTGVHLDDLPSIEHWCFRSDEEVRVENLRKRYVPRKAFTLMHPVAFDVSRRIMLVFRLSVSIKRCIRVTVSWALSWDEMPISTRRNVQKE